MVKKTIRIRLWGKDIDVEEEVEDESTNTIENFQFIKLFGVQVPPMFTSPSSMTASSSSSLPPQVQVATPSSLPPQARSMTPSCLRPQMPRIQRPPRRGRRLNSRANNEEELNIPELPARVRTTIELMGGSNITFLVEKDLEQSDVKESYHRLFIPRTCLSRLTNILNDDEKQILRIRDGIMEPRHIGGTNGIEGEISVKVIDGNNNKFDIDFKTWPSLRQLVFIKDWKELVEKNTLVAGDKIQIWSFRHDNMKLGFAVVKKEREGTRDCGSSSNASSSVLNG